MIEELKQALKEDKTYYEGWVANIASSFYDEYTKKMKDKRYLNKNDIHEISEAAARKFLEILMME